MCTPPSNSGSMLEVTTSTQETKVVEAQMPPIALMPQANTATSVTAMLSKLDRSKLDPDQLKDLLKRSLQEQLAELTPAQRLQLQKKLVQQRLREHAKRKKVIVREDGVAATIVVDSASAEAKTIDSIACLQNKRRSQRMRRNSTQALISAPLSAALSMPFNPSDPIMEPSAASTNGGMHVCLDCGKEYKHKNCLIKHQWEHHAAWEETKLFCQTKHQQVQLLEAAQMLVDLTDRLSASGNSGGESSSRSNSIDSSSFFAK